MKRLAVAATASMLAGIAVGALAIQSLHAQAKPPVYFVVENEISDVQSYLKDAIDRRSGSASGIKYPIGANRWAVNGAFNSAIGS
jgi:hypothetical protein